MSSPPSRSADHADLPAAEFRTAARPIGISWLADRALTAPTAIFRDFALTYAGRLPEIGIS